MYQPASKKLDLVVPDLYTELSKPKTTCCNICKKVSERKKKSREVHKDITEFPILPTPLECLDPQTVAMITTTALPALQHFDTAAVAVKTENPFSEENANTTLDRCRYHRCHRSPHLTMRRLCTLILFCTVFSIAEGCGPGRGIGGPRRNRKLTPLVFKQHVPNMSERTLGASGLNEGAIKRDSPKFKNLVPNYNRDIIFKDDEGTGADRLMSRRCKEKLNILAVSVMNQWPGVRLRVTESWDEDNAHHTDSLHYEGRAVDITTSDRDRTKYGMLARLAVEAGFDWVYYESRAHIHCSVKSDSKHIPHVSGCFAAESSVLLANGQRKSLRDLNIGDRVLAMSSTGKPVYSEVILFMDRNLEQMEYFVRIHTDGDDNRNHNHINHNNDTTLTVTRAHLVLIWHPIEQKLEYIFADRVQEDDYVFVHDHYGRLSPRRVKRLEVVRRMGVVAPLTREGTIVVDSVTASCYAVVNSQTIAHWGLAPMRLMATIASWIPSSSSSSSSRLAVNATTMAQARTNTTIASTAAARQINGIHWYAQFLNALKDMVLPQRWIYQ